MKHILFTCFSLLVAFNVFSVSAKNFSHINTFGFDYIDLTDRPELAEILAKQHDWVIGPVRGGMVLNSNVISYDTYDALTSTNPDVKIMAYIPYNTVMPYMSKWMEEWCIKNKYDPELLYLHYYNDVEVNTTQGKKRISGYGGGGASSLVQARVVSKWWGGQYFNINPASEVFRMAYNALARELSTIHYSKGIFAHGLFLDSYNATIESKYWNRQLNETIEFQKLGLDSKYKALKYMEKMIAAHTDELRQYLRSESGNKDFSVVVNAGVAPYIYKDYPRLFQKNRKIINEVCIEELVASTVDIRIIKYLKDIYDDMEAGRTFWLRSQTNYSSRQKIIPEKFKQGILATHYLINHKNGYFFYHEGSPVNYGGNSGDLSRSHWNINIEYNIGNPLKTRTRDYWGKIDTDRFFVYDKDEHSTVLARQYTNGLVLMKFAALGKGGWNNIGQNVKTYKLSRPMRLLNADNSLGPAVNEIRLGNTEGIILVNTKN